MRTRHTAPLQSTPLPETGNLAAKASYILPLHRLDM